MVQDDAQYRPPANKDSNVEESQVSQVSQVSQISHVRKASHRGFGSRDETRVRSALNLFRYVFVVNSFFALV